MGDIEFQEYINRLIENSIVGCDDQVKDQELEKCKKCLQNAGFNENREVICTRFNCKNI